MFHQSRSAVPDGEVLLHKPPLFHPAIVAVGDTEYVGKLPKVRARKGESGDVNNFIILYASLSHKRQSTASHLRLTRMAFAFRKNIKRKNIPSQPAGFVMPNCSNWIIVYMSDAVFT
ncbi:hypothetical protein D917_00750, partial [Trichinella nativa]